MSLPLRVGSKLGRPNLLVLVLCLELVVVAELLKLEVDFPMYTALISLARLLLEHDVALGVVLRRFFPGKRSSPSSLWFRCPFGRGLVTLLIDAASRGVRLVVG